MTATEKGLLAGRQNPLAGEAADEEVERWLSRIPQHFGSTWLKAGGANVLQRLWKRRDALATSELLSLGHALDRLTAHRKWVDAQVRIAKGNDSNNAAGAIFEILALGQLDGTDAFVLPAKGSQPGFDGTLNFRPEGRLTVSLKRYGTSTHQAELNRRAEAIRADVREALRSRAADGFGLLALANVYPSAEHWAELRALVTELAGLPCPAERKVDHWYVRTTPLADGRRTIASGCASLTVQLIAPFHQNEADNLRSKLLDACSNLARHGLSEDLLSANIVYVHVPASASIGDCAAWVREWFVDFPNKPVSAVFLYQPSVVRTSNNASQIHHCYMVERRGGTAPLLPGKRDAVPNVTVPIGIAGSEPTIEQIVAEDGRVMRLTGCYVFQRGDVYREMARTEAGGWSVNLSSPAPGIHEHAVLPASLGGSGKTALQPRFAPSDELLIL